MKITTRKIHRYLSVAIAIQLLLWTISGIYFSFTDIKEVRGSHYRMETSSHLDVESLDLTWINANIESASRLNIIKRLNQTMIEVTTENGTIYLDRQGEPLNKLTKEQAKQIVSEQTVLQPIRVDLIEQEEVGSEFRGRSLPLFRVAANAADGQHVHIYLDTDSGKIVAIRNDQWRLWDLMWGLHIMDWNEREDFGHWLLRIFSILALISSLTGIWIFIKK